MVERKARASSADPSKPPFRFQGVSALSQSIARFAEEARTLDRLTAATAADEDATTEQLTRLNDALSRVERASCSRTDCRAALVQALGLCPRPDHRLRLLAPPGVRQAITTSNTEMLVSQVAALVDRIDAATAALKDAALAAQAK